MGMTAVGPNRATRVAAKHTPGRQAARLQAAKGQVLDSCAELQDAVARGSLDATSQAALIASVRLVSAQARSVALNQPHPTRVLRTLGSQVRHLSRAHAALLQAQRVSARLGTIDAPGRAAVHEAAADVVSLVSEQSWNGPLVAACVALRVCVGDAESYAASHPHAG